MPHQCTTCDRTFPDGSKEMLTGCPDCGGNKFQFMPEGAMEATPSPPPDETPNTELPDPPDDGGDDGIIESPVKAAEDTAQASARSAVVSTAELRNAQSTTNDQDTGSGPDMEELRQELDDQFESIKILQPGEYELNLMELYDREEYIIALREDGRYVIDMPGEWRSDSAEID